MKEYLLKDSHSMFEKYRIMLLIVFSILSSVLSKNGIQYLANVLVLEALLFTYAAQCQVSSQFSLMMFIYNNESQKSEKFSIHRSHLFPTDISKKWVLFF